MPPHNNSLARPSDIRSLLDPRSSTSFEPLAEAVIKTVAYADVFTYPLTANEIHQFLVGVPAADTAVAGILSSSQLLPRYLEQNDGFYTLPERSHIVKVRRQRAASSAELWPAAIYYGRILAQLPFVRMTTITGALAVNNAVLDDDIDYLVVTEPGRLWLCRALVILVVKAAALRGHMLCPNYFLSEDALILPEQDLFTAHELLQMVPAAGLSVYQKMVRLNRWVGQFLPNAYAAEGIQSSLAPNSRALTAVLERVLKTTPGSWFEKWEMERKITRFAQQEAETLPRGGVGSSSNGTSNLVEISFNANRCKGHFNLHGSQALRMYKSHMKRLGLEDRNGA